MAVAFSPLAVTEKINSLLAERQQYADALSRIDQMLAKVGVALGQSGRRGRPASTTKSAAAPKASPRKGKRTKYAMTGEQSIISFIQKKGSPVTSDITKHWASEGRGGKVDNILSAMVKAGKLKRKPLVGKRGSTYLVA